VGVKGGVKCSFYNRDKIPPLLKGVRGISGLIGLSFWSSGFGLYSLHPEAWTSEESSEK